eukprot:3294785-Rhodomonas_salina.2
MAAEQLIGLSSFADYPLSAGHGCSLSACQSQPPPTLMVQFVEIASNRLAGIGDATLFQKKHCHLNGQTPD